MGKENGKEKESSAPLWITVFTGIVPLWVAIIGGSVTVMVALLSFQPFLDLFNAEPTATATIQPSQISPATATDFGITTPESTQPQIAIPTDSILTATPTSDPGFGMHVILVANQTRGRNPLKVVFDARDSYFVASDGAVFPCGACNYWWSIRTGATTLFGPENTDGKLEYSFGRRGNYFVSVYVCRSGSDTECGGSGTEIVVE